MNGVARCAALAALLTIGVVGQATRAQCTITKKRSPVGEPANLPVDGWFVYGLNDVATGSFAPGVYKSPLNSFQPAVVPGTENMTWGEVEISSDGKWLLVNTKLSSGTVDSLCLVNVENGTVVNVNQAVAPLFDHPEFCGIDKACWYRSSPYGAEIAFSPAYTWHNWKNYFRCTGNPLELAEDSATWVSKDVPSGIYAIRVDLSGPIPTFGALRPIARDLGYSSSEGLAVAGAHIVMRAVVAGGSPAPNGCLNITIPDGGRGIAGRDNIYGMSAGKLNEVYSRFACGLTLRHDGEQFAGNIDGLPVYPGESEPCCEWNVVITGEQASSDEGEGCCCVPGNHRGFSVLPFKEEAGPDELVRMPDWLFKEGVSINWCPLEQRQGNKAALEFHHWYWGNHDEYIIGIEHGAAAPVYGVWFVHWPSNTWSLLTSPTTRARQPAYFLQGFSSRVKSLPNAGGTPVQPQPRRTFSRDDCGAVYTVHGRRVDTRPRTAHAAPGVYVLGRVRMRRTLYTGKEQWNR